MTSLAQTARALPIWTLHEPLRAAWRQQNRLVLIAPTGSGKTTQVCQMLLEDGHAGDRQIIVLQPRRVATRSVAARVAAERGVALGGEVGYLIRFDDRASAQTRILFMTEGVLLRRLQDEPDLASVGAILFDEFHERNLFSDVALGLAKQLQAARRPDLLIMVMSATLDAEPVAKFLGDCPILRSEGRSFPVTIKHLDAPDRRPPQEVAADAVEHILASGKPGDILVFMPGVWEIQQTLNAVRSLRSHEPLALLPLYGELPPNQQDLVFQPSVSRKVIVATNVAETSVTIDGVRFVVDSGLARINRYDPALGISALRIEPISHASADQRAGRAGRTAPGECSRLWTFVNHKDRPKTNTPEIHRTDLASVVLLLRSLGVQDIAGFDLPDKMDPAAVQAALEMLERLGAVTPASLPAQSASEKFAGKDAGATGRITGTGRQMLRLPVHPRYARMLIEASRRGCVRTIALWAALVSGRDMMVRAKDESAKEMLEIFQTNENSDFFTLSRAFQWARQRNFSLEACRRAGIHALTAANVEDTYEQLLDLCEKNGIRGEDREHADDDMLKCVLAGFVDHLARRVSKGTLDCVVAGKRSGTLMRESVVQKSDLLVTAEIRQIATREGKEMTLLGLASEVKLEWLRELFADQLVEKTEHLYDRVQRRVACVRLLRYRDLILDHTHQNCTHPKESAAALAKEFLAENIELPLWNHELDQWLARVKLVARLFPELEIRPYDDAAKLECLSRALAGTLLYKEAKEKPLLPAFREFLTPVQRDFIADLTPESVTLANGKRCKLVYDEDGPPAITVKLNDLFGVKDQPRVCDGKVAVAVHLTAPDGKRLETTQDLEAFWKTGYPQLKRGVLTKYKGVAWL
ncbi:MAG: ATP-dependent helicase HrpB [Verrucomicrobia bacterium]|nr:ATP-dependent helicase HrpB [Verrucomicrobiota bacterium]